ncbi:hypothetical protein [Mucilaginibacter gossypii]|uniref:hypothetical protein n=1 Tax=Mucilaginibacter gossypii TaxID=551996 RepID=UPI0034E88315
MASSAKPADVAVEVPQLATYLTEAFWPGPLTLVFEKTSFDRRRKSPLPVTCENL